MRKVILTLAFSAFAMGRAMAGDLTQGTAGDLIMYKHPQCGCCQGWADYMGGKGWKAKVVATYDLDQIKTKYKVPDNMQSCHTALIEGYVVEGHVPAQAVAKLLKERPKAVGIAAPGMPQGSPGMSGEPEHFTVYLFGPDGTKPFMQF